MIIDTRNQVISIRKKNHEEVLSSLNEFKRFCKQEDIQIEELEKPITRISELVTSMPQKDRGFELSLEDLSELEDTCDFCLKTILRHPNQLQGFKSRVLYSEINSIKQGFHLHTMRVSHEIFK